MLRLSPAATAPPDRPHATHRGNAIRRSRTNVEADSVTAPLKKRTEGSPLGVLIAERILGDSFVVRRLRALIAKVAPATVPVLIQGPTGSGKELVAQALHVASGRSGCFVPMNVSAVAESMFEATLFGHVRGAFTGATSDRRGLLVEADGGTLFLDEICTLKPELQAKLLRVLETRTFRPVGAHRDEHSTFRLVAATNDDLPRLVAAGAFRADLAYRLRGVVIEVPPLREHLDDIPVLAHAFAVGAQLGDAGSPAVSERVVRWLRAYQWPGNVRELRQVIEAALVLGDTSVLTVRAINAVLPPGRMADGPLRPVRNAERRRLYEALEQCEWDTAEVARVLHVNRATIYRRMARLGVVIPPDHPRRRGRALDSRPQEDSGPVAGDR
jgi:DNA-binding NtrC family response regulator